MNKAIYFLSLVSYCVCVKRKKLCNCHSIFSVFSFSPSRHFFWTDCQNLFSQRFIISYQESVWPRSDSFLGHTKKSLYKIVPQVVTHDACGTWHGLCTVTSIHSHQKSTRISQELGNNWNKLASWFMAEYSRVKPEKNRVDKLKSLKKQKRKMFRLRSWLLLHVKQYKKLLLQNICHQKAKKPTFCWSMMICCVMK